MSYRVVCISRTLAAQGEAVGQRVAERLGFQYVDEQIIKRAAELAQVDPGLVAAAETRQPLMRRLVDKLAAAQEMLGPVALGTLLPIGARARATSAAAPEDPRTLIRAAIHEVALRGQAVIVAHAASIALASVDGVLRVMVTASAETRARRLAEAEGMSEADANAAVAQSDRNRKDYLRRFYELDEEHSTHYDLVVNTDVLTPDAAGALVAFAAHARA